MSRANEERIAVRAGGRHDQRMQIALGILDHHGLDLKTRAVDGQGVGAGHGGEVDGGRAGHQRDGDGGHRGTRRRRGGGKLRVAFRPLWVIEAPAAKGTSMASVSTTVRLATAVAEMDMAEKSGVSS